MILHLVDKAEPDKVTGANVIDQYGDWIVAGVSRLQDHTKAFKDIPDTKPVMFIMCETIQHADKIGQWLTDKSSPFKLKDAEVLIIHTDKEGEIKKGAARRAAPESPRYRRPGEPGPCRRERPRSARRMGRPQCHRRARPPARHRGRQDLA